MAFPETVLPIKVEAKFNGWTDITSEVYNRGEISITRGRSDETGTAQTSSCAMQLDNRNGKFSPRNPTGAYYGLIGRNTPLRVSVTEGERYLYLTGENPNYISCPDSVATSITGDIEVQVDIALRSFQDGNAGAGNNLTGKYDSTAGQRSWLLSIFDGRPTWQWSANGTDVLFASATERPCPASDRFAIKVTHDVNNGAGGNTVTFYTATSIAGPWTQLGEPVVSSGTTSIFNSTSPTYFAAAFPTNVNYTEGRFYAGKVLNGIGGTVVASPDVRSLAVGTTSFSDGSNTWTVSGTGAEITDRKVRFTGEVTSWPVKWDQSVTDVWAEVEGSGILRRLSQGSAPFKSSMYRGVSAIGSTLRAYWPCEDGNESQFFGTALSNGRNMFFSGSPSIGANSDFQCSESLPTVSGSTWVGSVRGYTSSDNSVAFLMAVPAAGETNNAVICKFKTKGDTAYWTLTYGTGGTLNLTGYNEAGGVVATTGNAAFAVNGKLLDIQILLDDTGTDLTASLIAYEVGETVSLSISVVAAATNVTGVTEVSFGSDKLTTDTAIGHVRVVSSVAEVFSLMNQVNAWNGEPAGRRIKRLCQEEGIPFAFVGDNYDTTPMGHQGQGTFLDLVRQCEAADGGMIFEPRRYLALGYRTKKSLYTQASTATFDYANNDLSGFEPIDDDQTVFNDVTVNRVDGASARQIDTTSPLSINEPPNGVGRYDTEYSLNLYEDAYLDHHASWRLHLGTVDEQRYPGITVQLQRQPFTDNPSLYINARNIDVGDRIVIENVPTFISTQDVEQIILGYRETMSQFNRTISFNSAPASAYYVAYYNTTHRYSGEGTVTNALSITTTQTTIDISCPIGVGWTDVDGDYDIIINGEVMTVTSVTPLDVPTGTQTLTVIRSVNGIIKTHGPGEAVRLAKPSYWALTV